LGHNLHPDTAELNWDFFYCFWLFEFGSACRGC